MGFLQRIRFFQKVAVGIFMLYMGIMLFVAVNCFSRPSSNTGLDMAKVQQMRLKAHKEKHQIADAE